MKALPFPTRSTPDPGYSLLRPRGVRQWPLLLKLGIAGVLAAALAAFVSAPVPALLAGDAAAAPATLSFAWPPAAESAGHQVDIYTPHSGVVIEKHVSEGQQVEKGETLYVLFSEPAQKAVSNVHHARSERLRQRLGLLRREMVQAHDAHAVELDNLRRSIHDTRSKLSWMMVQVKEQKSAVEEAAAAVPHDALRSRPAESGYRHAHAALAHLRRQEDRLQMLEARHGGIHKRLAEQRRSLHAMPLQQANALARIQRAMSEISNEIEQNDGKRRIVVAAPQAGVATTVNAQVGHRVDDARPLLAMMPVDWSAEQVCVHVADGGAHCS